MSGDTQGDSVPSDYASSGRTRKARKPEPLPVVGTWSAPGHLIRRAQRVHTALWNKVFGSEVTGPQYATMVAIAMWPESDQQTAGELAGLDKATMAGVIKRLEARGLILRKRAEDDRRRLLLLLTPDAENRMDDFAARAEAVHNALVARLPAGTESEAISLLRKVTSVNEPSFGAASAPQAFAVVEPSTALGYLLRRALQIHVALWNEEFHGEITSPQYAVLSAVAAADSADQLKIAELAGLDASSAADVVGRMEKDGWLRRETDTTDRRRLKIALTQPARMATLWASPGVERVQLELLSALTPKEKARLVKLLQHLIRGSDPE